MFYFAFGNHFLCPAEKIFIQGERLCHIFCCDIFFVDFCNKPNVIFFVPEPIYREIKLQKISNGNYDFFVFDINFHVVLDGFPCKFKQSMR